MDRLAVRQIGTRFLSQDERIEIADLRQPGLSMRAIDDLTRTAPQHDARAWLRPFDAHRLGGHRRISTPRLTAPNMMRRSTFRLT